MTKKNNNQNPPQSIEEAVVQEPNQEVPPEMNQSELVTQALADARIEERLTVVLPQGKKPKLDLGTETLALSTDPPLVITDSSPESPPKNPNKPAEVDNDLVRLIEYVLGDSFTENLVGYAVTSICSTPRGIPFPGTWNCERRNQISNFVYHILIEPGYLESIWPFLKIVMSSNAGNSYWTANVAISIALHDSLRFLPFVDVIGTKE